MAFKIIIALAALATAQAGFIESNNGGFGSPHLLLNSQDQHHNHHHQQQQQDLGYTGGDYHYNTYKVASANVPVQVTNKLYTDQLFSVNPHHQHHQQQQQQQHMPNDHITTLQYPTQQYHQYQPSAPIHTTAIGTAGLKHTKTIDYSTPIYKSIDFNSHILSSPQQVVHKNYEYSIPTIQKSLEYTIPSTPTIQKTLQQYTPSEVASVGQKSLYYAEPVTYAHKTTHHQQQPQQLQQYQQYPHQQMPLTNGHASYTTISAPKTYTTYAAPVFESHTANIAAAAAPVFHKHNNPHPHHHHHHQYETQENIHGDNIGVISHFEKSIISSPAVVQKTYTTIPKYNNLENYKISAVPSVTLQKYTPQQQSPQYQYNHDTSAPLMHRYATTSPSALHQYAPSSSSIEMMNKKYTIPVQYKSTYATAGAAATHGPSSSSSSFGHQDQLTSGHQYAHSAPVIAHKAIHYSPSDVVAHATFESADAHYSW